MSRKISPMLVALIVAVLTACGSSTSGTSSQNGSPQAAGSPIGASSANAGGTQSALPTQVDPCTLLTASEASQLVGASVTHTGGIPGHACTYGAPPHMVGVNLYLAPAGSSPQSSLSQLAQQLAAQGGTKAVITALPSFAGGAYVIRLSGGPITISQIVVISGTFFVEVGTIPSVTDEMLEGAVTLAAGRLP